MRAGPTKLVLINAGRFPYAELALDAPVHLVGANNVGKTSLIAALQFLYVDDQQRLHFSRDLATSRKYYFRDTRSYILFECITPVGYRVIGVRGLGDLRDNHFEYFAYDGRFERDAFIDESRRPRSFDEIKPGLATAGFTILKPHELRSALTGIGECPVRSFDLVPLAARDQYEHFRRMFVNLLRLSNVGEPELRQLIVAVNKEKFVQTEFDVGRKFRETLEHLQRQEAAIRELDQLAPRIMDAVELYAEVRGARTWSAAVWRDLKQRDDKDRRSVADATARISNQVSESLELADAQRSRAATRLKDARDKSTVLGGIQTQLGQLEEDDKRFATYVPEFADVRLASVKARLSELAVLLSEAKIDPVAEEKKCISLAASLARKEAALTNWKRTVAAALGTELGSETVQDVFGVLNPALLHLDAGADGSVTVRDRAALLQKIVGIAHRISDGRYTDEAVEFPLSQHDVAFDEASLRQEVEEIRQAYARSVARLDAARKAEEYRREQQTLDEERSALTRERGDFDSYRHRKAVETQLRRSVQQTITEITRFDAEREQAERAANDADHEVQRLEAERNALLSARESRASELGRLMAAPEGWSASNESFENVEWSVLVRTYRDRRIELSSNEKLLKKALDEIETQTHSRYVGVTEEETLARLREQLDALDGSKKAFENASRSFTTDLAEGLRQLVRSVSVLEGQVSRLNRELAKVSVSNLRNLRIVFQRDEGLLGRLETIVSRVDQPLLTPRDMFAAASQFLLSQLSQDPCIRLEQLFRLSFEVTQADGTSIKYASLDRVESNGTTIMIKVLINILLLRGLMNEADVRIPFYLDEVGSLDRENLRALVDIAQQRGFIAVLASPEPSDVATRLYFLHDDHGRVVLDPELSCVEVRRGARADAA